MKKTILWSMLAFLSFIMFGCGSGDFFNGTTITGMGSKGPISGAQVSIFAVLPSGQVDKQLATATTGSDGRFSANIGSYTGAIFAQMSGSSQSTKYTDEATNTTQNLGQTRLRVATKIKSSGNVNLAITPLTEIACRQAQTAPNTFPFANVSTANSNISQAFGVRDIVGNLPSNIASTALPVVDPNAIKYSLALAAFSQYLSTNSLTSIDAGVAPLSAASNSTISSYVSTAISNLAQNTKFTNNFQSGLLNVPVNIAFTSASYSAIFNQAIPVTVNVTKFDGSAYSGAKVTFLTSNGTFDNSSATTDSSGNATVNLTPAMNGSVYVSASATVSATSTTPSVTVSTVAPTLVTVVANPYSPGFVNLSTSSSSVQVNQSVTLTARVGVVGGGSNSVIPGSPPPAGTLVTFTIFHNNGANGTLTSTTSGSSSSSVTALTDVNGNATASLTGILTGNTPGSIVLNASAGTSPSVVSKNSSGTPNTLSVTIDPDPLAPATVTVSPTGTSWPADGSSDTINVLVANYLGTPLSNATLAVTTSVGSLSTQSPTIGANGTASFTLSLSSSTAQTATVTVRASAAGATATGTAQIKFTAYTRPTGVIIKLSTVGPLNSGSTAIGSLDEVLTFPSGLTIDPSTGGVVSGVAASVTPNPALAYNVQTAGTLSISMSGSLKGSTVVGFPVGEFATFTFAIPSTATVPKSTDFIASNSSSVTDVYDNNRSPALQTSITFQISSFSYTY